MKNCEVDLEVARIEGRQGAMIFEDRIVRVYEKNDHHSESRIFYSPTTDWSLAGPLIAKYNDDVFDYLMSIDDEQDTLAWYAENAGNLMEWMKVIIAMKANSVRGEGEG